MKLNEIIDEIFAIASAIEYNTISYFNPLLVSVRNKAKPDDRLLAIAAPLKQKVANGIPISKAEVTASLNELKAIAKEYKIEALRKPIKNLESYRDSLD